MTLLREARKWWNLDIENEGDLLDIVIERPEDLDHLTFNWKTIGFDMANDGLVGSPSDAALNDQMEFLARTLPHLDNLNLTLFPSPLAFLTFQGLTTTPAGRELLAPGKRVSRSRPAIQATWARQGSYSSTARGWSSSPLSTCNCQAMHTMWSTLTPWRFCHGCPALSQP